MINLDTKITKSELKSYKISIKKLDESEKELPITLILDKKNRQTIKVIPRVQYESGSVYLLQTVNVTKKDTKMTILPFEVKVKKQCHRNDDDK